VSSKPPDSLYDWHVFADATCAGLSVLIPLPLVDLVFESTFRRRIPGTISRFRLSPVEAAVKRKLGGPLHDPLSLHGCFGALFAAVKYILRRIWRKIIYILAIKDAATALTEYWHRAALIDHMVRAGHLEPGVDTTLAVEIYSGVLREIDPSPLIGLARQTIANVHHVLRLLIQARRLGAVAVTRSLGDLLASQWRVADQSLKTTTRLYNRRYASAVESMKKGALPGESNQAHEENGHRVS
jgi:hypothetical protein